MCKIWLFPLLTTTVCTSIRMLITTLGWKRKNLPFGLFQLTVKLTYSTYTEVNFIALAYQARNLHVYYIMYLRRRALN